MNLEKTMKRILLLLLLCVHTMWPAVETCAAEIAERYPLCTEHPVRKVRLPELPDSLDAAGKTEYVLAHYWDGFDFEDRTWIADTVSMEQAFADWAFILLNIPQEIAVKHAGRPIAKAAVDSPMFVRFLEIAGHYFDDPGSPYRSEEIYIPILEAAVAASGIEDIYKVGSRVAVQRARRNHPGEPAAEFVGTTAEGGEVSLSQLGGEYKLLFFYTPGCPECRRAEQYIASSKLFRGLIDSGRLSVLAIYPDTDYEQWRRHLAELPAGWTVVCDPRQQINLRQTYVVRATPSFYLLDGQNKVILKDVFSVERIEAWLAGYGRDEKREGR